MGRDDHDWPRELNNVTNFKTNNVHSNAQGNKKFCKRFGFKVSIKTTFPVNDQFTGRKSFEDHLYFGRSD